VILKEAASLVKGMDTGKNDRFLRLWFEVSSASFLSKSENGVDVVSPFKWVPYKKGGTFRKWYGNIDHVIEWRNDGRTVKGFEKSNIRNKQHYFKSGISWTLLSSSGFGARYDEIGSVFDANSPSLYSDERIRYGILGLLNSNFASKILGFINPTLAFQKGDVEVIPFSKKLLGDDLSALVKSSVEAARFDWIRHEEQSDCFKVVLRNVSTVDAYLEQEIGKYESIMFKLHEAEEKVNLIVGNIYKVESSICAEVPLQRITAFEKELDRKSLAKLNTQLKRDSKTGLVTNYEELTLPFKRDIILQQFISYAVGCMMGRYSLDAEGLVLANAGDTLAQYAVKTGKAAGDWAFAPDEDGILPVLAGEYFPDDVVGEFRTFLRAAFGEAHFVENLAFVEECIGKDIRSYFVRDFYKDHVQRYKKRPIYWMFQSPGKHFRALVYLHRYRPDTVGRLLNDYLRPFIDRLNTERHNAQALVDDAGSSASASNAARKTIETANAAIRDCEVYQKDLLELARQRIDLDLDDGVLVNYNKMGGAVEVIGGVNDAKGRKKVEGFDWVDWDWGEG
jgi:hypothetical protein